MEGAESVPHEPCFFYFFHMVKVQKVLLSYESVFNGFSSNNCLPWMRSFSFLWQLIKHLVCKEMMQRIVDGEFHVQYVSDRCHSTCVHQTPVECHHCVGVGNLYGLKWGLGSVLFKYGDFWWFLLLAHVVPCSRHGLWILLYYFDLRFVTCPKALRTELISRDCHTKSQSANLFCDSPTPNLI